MIETLLNMATSKYRLLLCILVGGLCLTACHDDDEAPSPVAAETRGTFTDPRDNETYGWVRYAGLDWMTENYRYNIQDDVNSTIYLDADENGSSNAGNNPNSTRNLARYGRLYTLSGAQTACPDGWRIPTDTDWQQLEQALGLSADDAATDGWRGNIAPLMLSIYGTERDLNILLGGYYATNTLQRGWRFMGAYGYYWSSTPDPQKEGEYYYVRKFTYARNEVCRMSMEPSSYKLSVRYVRNAQ